MLIHIYIYIYKLNGTINAPNTAFSSCPFGVAGIEALVEGAEGIGQLMVVVPGVYPVIPVMSLNIKAMHVVL